MRTATIAVLVLALAAAATPLTVSSGVRKGNRRVFDFAAVESAVEGAAATVESAVESVLPFGLPATQESKEQELPSSSSVSLSAFSTAALPAFVAAAGEPAGEGILRQALFDALLPNAIAILSNLATTLEIPDVTSIENVAVLGKIDFTLSDIRIQSLEVNRDRSYISLEEGFGSLGFADINARITARWRFRQRNFPFTSGDGDAIVKASRGNIAAIVDLDATQDGFIEMAVPSSVTQFSNIDIDVKNSGWSWLLNIITSVFNGSIRGTINTQLNNLIKETLPTEANNLFRSQPLSVNVLNLFNLDVAWQQHVLITGENIDARNYLMISAIDGTPCPFKSGLNTRSHADTYNVLMKQGRLYIDQSGLQCAVWAATRNVNLQATIKQSDLPDNIVILNTDSWDELVPIIAKLYPNRPMEVDASIVGSPLISITRASGAVAIVQAVLNFFVIENSGARTPLFVLNTDIRVTLEQIKITQSPDFSKNTINIALESIDIQTSLASSSVGEIDMEPVQETFEALAYLAVSVVNSDYIPSFDLPPIPYARLVSPIIEYSEGEVVFASNFALSTTPYFTN